MVPHIRSEAIWQNHNLIVLPQRKGKKKKVNLWLASKHKDNVNCNKTIVYSPVHINIKVYNQVFHLKAGNSTVSYLSICSRSYYRMVVRNMLHFYSCMTISSWYKYASCLLVLMECQVLLIFQVTNSSGHSSVYFIGWWAATS